MSWLRTEDLSRQREFHVNEIGSLKAQLVPRLSEIESLTARFSKMALPQSSSLATVGESLAVDDDEEDDEGGNDEEPGISSRLETTLLFCAYYTKFA